MSDDVSLRWKAAVAGPALSRYLHLYRKTENVVHAWSAYNVARRAELPIPGWVREIFDEWAKTLTPSTPKSAKALADELGIGTKGGRTVPAKAATDHRNLDIVYRVLRLATGEPFVNGKPSRQPMKKIDAMFEVAEEEELSYEQVRRIFYELTTGGFEGGRRAN